MIEQNVFHTIRGCANASRGFQNANHLLVRHALKRVEEVRQVHAIL